VAGIDTLTAADFAPHLDTPFRVDGAFDVALAEVAEADGGAGRRQFSLLFRGGPTPPLPQRIYALEHAALGRLELFLVPLGPDADGQRYEAVFA
jgi:hypothetical protein